MFLTENQVWDETSNTKAMWIEPLLKELPQCTLKSNLQYFDMAAEWLNHWTIASGLVVLSNFKNVAGCWMHAVDVK